MTRVENHLHAYATGRRQNFLRGTLQGARLYPGSISFLENVLGPKRNAEAIYLRKGARSHMGTLHIQNF